MNKVYLTEKEDKIHQIREVFTPLIGHEINAYEYAQLWIDGDDEWSDWMDLPLYLTIGKQVVSIVWNHFDQLLLMPGRFIPFSLAGSTVKWINDDNTMLDDLIGKKLSSVSLGRGEMSIKGKEIEIWTRLVLELDDGSHFEIYNVLDENAFKCYKDKPNVIRVVD